jgi:6-pyruvoyl-tetrahydropterin synthase
MNIATECMISKDFGFSASHQLIGLHPEHRCARVHGHNYVVRVELTGVPDAVGFVMDYGDLDPFRKWLDAMVDHRHLNEVVQFNPTAELLARWMIDSLIEVVPLMDRISVIRLGISETSKTWAWATWAW